MQPAKVTTPIPVKAGDVWGPHPIRIRPVGSSANFDLSAWSRWRSWARRDESTVHVECAVDTSRLGEGVLLLSLTGEQTRTLVGRHDTAEGRFDAEAFIGDRGPVTWVEGDLLLSNDVTKEPA
ncbi:hypothetical protein [Pseudoclavibacter sp. RFBA6]|uniref:hypothetical protein n=1 Tax=Pseudoclavibacter sp. RFBA6 TaxID=2080573 RepID=UPI000CE8F9C7|nr:hypothetical protein [Pseudoclavibacter sp. RFBA6]PPG39478.1 hypothetical protein C5C17_11855 [Pseudoclavibacter sp. RFBA6]